MSDREFDYCPSCSGDLNTGWECTDCGLDWMEHATLGSENGKYSENAKFGYSVMFIIAIIVFCICLATGKVYLIIAGLLFSTVIIIGCFGAVKSDRWDD